MTLLIGVQCTNGVVLGADSSATLATNGADVNDLAHKITLVGDHALIAIGGASAMGLQFEHGARTELESLHVAGELATLAHPELAAKISEQLIPAFLALKIPELAVKAKELPGGEENLASILARCLIATFTNAGPCLLAVNEFGLTDCADKVPYAVEGNGDVAALPFLGYIRQHVWKNQPPDVGAGILAVLWAFRYAGRANPERLSEPYQLGVVERIGERLQARFLSETDLSEPKNLLDDFETNVMGQLLGRVVEEEKAQAPPVPSSERRRRGRRNNDGHHSDKRK